MTSQWHHNSGLYRILVQFRIQEVQLNRINIGKLLMSITLGPFSALRVFSTALSLKRFAQFLRGFASSGGPRYLVLTNSDLTGISKTCDHVQIKIKIRKPNQVPPVSSEAPNQDLKDMVVLCPFKVQKYCQKLEHWSIKGQWPYTNQDQYCKHKSGAPSMLKSPKSWVKGHGCTLHPPNQDREPKFGTWVY